MMKISALFTSLALSWGIVSALQLADDPQSYFGGDDNAGYLDWLAANDIETKYIHSVFIPSIDPGLGAAVHWTADDEFFHVAVAARATGWVGFGLSDAGGMLGSDFALFSVNRPTEIVDAHAIEEFFPKEDDCQHDWIFVNSSLEAVIAVEREGTSGDFIMFEARRKLVTDDPQDRSIVKDNILEVPEQRIISAWGNTPDVSYHGSSNARGSIRIFKSELEESDFDTLMARDADGSFFVGADNFEIPTNRTTYQDFCVSRADMIAQGVPDSSTSFSAIGFKPIVNIESGRMVHHYVVTGTNNASEAVCSGEHGYDTVYVWAPGDGGFALPDFLGAVLFGEDGFQSFTVQIHYDNPHGESGVLDSSGVEIFYSMTPRPVEMAVLQVGDPSLGLYGLPVGDGLSGHHFNCPGTCSGAYQSDGEPVTVFREYLHMHITGTRTQNDVIRNGEVVRSSSTEVWEFDQNGNVPVRQQPYELYPGDAFRTSCYYRANTETIFALGSDEEMCIAFLYYYPKKSFKYETPYGNATIPFVCGLYFDYLDGACNATYEPEGILESDEGMHRLFGKLPEECLLPDASASDPAVDLEAATTNKTETEMETETAAESSPAPAPTGPVSGATSVCSGAGLFIASVFAGLFL